MVSSSDAPRQTLDPRVLAAIGDLQLVARITVDGTVSGLHRSPFHGYSAEFSQYRHYRPGDDLKYVDWKLFARTDRFYTKQYRETTNTHAEIAVDVSASMAYTGRTGVSKLEYARLISAALTHLMSRQGDAVGLVAYDEQVRTFIPCRTGRLHERRLLLELSALDARGRTAAASALTRALGWLRRRGVLFVISDLYDESQAVEIELTRAVRMGHDVVVFHVLARDEIDFPFERDVELEDLETSATVLASPVAARAVYRQNVGAFLARWRTLCASHGMDYIVATTDTPLDETLRGYLVKRAGTPVR